jgi:hypothetical protein
VAPKKTQGLREWIAPGVIFGGLSLGFTVLFFELNGASTRIDGVDRRVGDVDVKIDRRAEAVERRIVETNQRIDHVLEQQARVSELISSVKTQIDRVANKLQVSEIPTSSEPTGAIQPTTPQPNRNRR